MSLLMEALKKAERAKQAAQERGEQSAAEGEPIAATGENSAGGEELQLAPDDPAAAAAAEAAPADTAGPNPLLRDPRAGRVDFPRLELESIDDREFDLDPVKPRAARADADETGRAAARAVFDAKQTDTARGSRVPLMLGVLAALVLLGGAGYWYVQKQFGGSTMLTPQLVASGQVAPRPALTPPPAPAVAVAAVAGPATASLNAPLSGVTPAATGAPSPLPRVEAVEPRKSDETGIAAPRPRVRIAGSARPPRRVASASRATAARDDPGAVKVRPSSTAVNPTLEGAYRAYLAGDMPAARSGYNTVLARDAENRDALLGLAGIAARENRYDEAESLYLRILHLDPADAYAQTGLVAIRGQADPVASESRLKTLIASQPNAAFLHYALGNLYARQTRWNEAQQEHFRAFTLDSENPDYCYNLAVSLDQIRQPQLALTHYQRALTLAALRPASFDAARLRARISELQRQ
jgi:tetratricopeptide (TPR) repeat protein